MRTIVHLGQHKTATTSIQMYLQEQSTVLCQRGLYVPLPGDIHALLNVYSLSSHRTSPLKDDLRKRKRAWYFWTLGWVLRAKIASHYQNARDSGCKDVIWSNEGLYLLNSDREYNRLVRLLAPHSEKVVAVCCFRDLDSFRRSYSLQLEKEGRTFSNHKDSYRYVREDSWLFDYDMKKEQLRNAFDETIVFSYDRQDNVGRFFEKIEYPVAGNTDYRRNVTT